MSISILSLSLSCSTLSSLFLSSKVQLCWNQKEKKKKLLLALVRLIFQVSLYSLVLIE